MDAEEVRDDLAVLLRPAQVDPDKAFLVVELVLERVGEIVFPVPPAARSIVLNAAARAYTNPHGVQSENVGPLARSFFRSVEWLTDQERADLAEMADATTRLSGAWTIHPGRPTR